MSDKFTPIHNEVIEALCKINLSPYEWRVLMVILRKTYGYTDGNGGRRKTEMIALSYISKATSLDRRLVSRAMQGLVKKGVISRDDSKTGLTKGFIHKGVISTDDRVTSVEMSKVTSVEMPNKEIYKETLSTNVLRGGKPQAFGNSKVNYILDAYKKYIGHKPTDKFVRNRAHNMASSIEKFLKENSDLHKDSFEETVDRVFKWYCKAYEFKGDTLDVVRRKMPIGLDKLSVKYQEERKNHVNS